MRKEAGFEVTDRINIYATGNQKIEEIFKKFEDKITEEVFADSIIFGETNGYVKEWNINGETVTMGVEINHK